MSVEDLLKEEAQRQIDIVLKGVEADYNRFIDSNIGGIWDFIFGYEVGRVQTAVIDYYRYKLLDNRGITDEEADEIGSQVGAIVLDRLHEIQEAISTAKANQS